MAVPDVMAVLFQSLWTYFTQNPQTSIAPSSGEHECLVPKSVLDHKALKILRCFTGKVESLICRLELEDHQNSTGFILWGPSISIYTSTY